MECQCGQKPAERALNAQVLTAICQDNDIFVVKTIVYKTV